MIQKQNAIGDSNRVIILYQFIAYNKNKKCGAIMIIYIVKSGDTIDSIANQYQVDPEFVIKINELEDPNELVIGQTIVILIPKTVHTVKEEDSLYNIALEYGISVEQLYQNNPWLSEDNMIYEGEKIVIDYEGEKLRSVSINGYAYPFIDREVLKKTLPYLTYLSIFTYGFTADGGLIPVDDQELIELAYNYGVAPIMMLSPLDETGRFSNQRASEMLNDEQAKQVLIQNVIGALNEKGYQGLDLDFEFIKPEDKELYINFVNELRKQLNAIGYTVNTDLAPKTSSTQAGLLYEAHDYEALGAASNTVLVMTYEWGYTYGPPMAVSPIESVRKVLDYAVSEIERYKIRMGMNNYGYDWPLPYVKGETAATTISNVDAVRQAYKYGAEILYDEFSQAPYYYYMDEDGIEHVVWFEDARSMKARLELISEYDLNGAGYWNIMRYFPQNWLVLNSLYQIRKVVE